MPRVRTPRYGVMRNGFGVYTKCMTSVHNVYATCLYNFRPLLC